MPWDSGSLLGQVGTKSDWPRTLSPMGLAVGWQVAGAWGPLYAICMGVTEAKGRASSPAQVTAQPREGFRGGHQTLWIWGRMASLPCLLSRLLVSWSLRSAVTHVSGRGQRLACGSEVRGAGLLHAAAFHGLEAGTVCYGPYQGHCVGLGHCRDPKEDSGGKLIGP